MARYSGSIAKATGTSRETQFRKSAKTSADVFMKGGDVHSRKTGGAVGHRKGFSPEGSGSVKKK